MPNVITRRQFLTRSLAALAGTIVVPKLFGDYTPTSPYRFALLADTHVNPPSTSNLKFDDNLRQVVHEVISGDSVPRAVFVVGDLAYMGGLSEDYRVFSGLTERIRTAGIPLHFAIGNHDLRENYWKFFPERNRPFNDRHVMLVPTKRANFFILDSKDGGGSGHCGDAQLKWLANALDAHPDIPAITMIHHNDGDINDGVALLNVILPRKQVKAHFWGHVHKWEVGSTLGLHMISLPSTAYGRTGWVDMALNTDSAQLQFNPLELLSENIKPVTLQWR